METTKLCSKCGKPGEFYKGKGKDGLRSWCKTCEGNYGSSKNAKFARRKRYKSRAPSIRLYHRDMRKRFFEEWMQILKDLGLDKCSRCGYDRCFGSIHFHHPDPRIKSESAARLFRQKPTEARIEKIKKTTPLCANCHGEEHFLEGSDIQPWKVRDCSNY